MTASRWFVIALTVTLGSLACAQGPAPRGQARSEAVSWSGCQVVELTGTVREVRCPDFALRLLQAASLTDAASLAALVTAFPEGADARPGELRVGRSTVPTMESSAMLFAVPYPGIGAGCMEPMGERRDRCRSALVEMARTRQLPPGVVFPEARMHFLGHALVLQRGCTMVGTERISCARTQASFDWRERPARPGDSVPDSLELLARVYRNRLHVTSESSIACTMNGVATSGLRLAADAQGHAMDIILCSALSEETLSVAMCFGRLSPGESWPEPCDQIFDGTIPPPTAAR